MSNTVDERVVKMQFDNTSFEKNVQTSLGTLAKLKDALHFDKIDMSGIASNIEKITNKVTGMHGVLDIALERISNKIVDIGQKIATEFVFNPPTDGFKEYELKMDSLKVIMESSHESLDTVNKYLNELNKYSDQTIYSFSDMTASIGKFTNAGVDLETSVNAIKGIANEAALAGASTNDASRAMYNFAQALSAGSVKLIDWKSIENANMATQDFKNELIKTAVELGTIRKEGDKYISTTTNMQGKVSEAFDATQGFNDSLAHQWMTTDVLTKTLGRYADANTDIGARATKAATEVRTFSAMMDALKESVGSGWATTWELIFGNMEEATEMWTSVNNVLSGFIDKFSDARNNVLKGWREGDIDGRTKLLEGLANVFKILGNVIKPFSDAMKVLIPPITGESLKDITIKFADFTEKIKNATENFPMKLFGKSEENQMQSMVKQTIDIEKVFGSLEKQSLNLFKTTSEGSEQAATDLETLRDVAKKVINGDFGNDANRVDALKKAGFDPEQIQAYVNKIHELSNGSWDLSDEMLDAAAKSLGLTETAAKAAEEATESAKEATDSAKDSVKDYEVEVGEIMSNGNLLTQILVTAGEMIKNVFGSGVKILGAVKTAWTEAFSPIKITLSDITKFHLRLQSLAGSLKISDSALERIKNTAKNFFTAFKTVVDLVTKFVIQNLPNAIRIGQTIASTIGDIVLRIMSFASSITSAVARSGALSKILDAISNVIDKVRKGFEVASEVIRYFGEKLSGTVKLVSNYWKLMHMGAQVSNALDKAFSKTSGKFDKFKKKLSEHFQFKTLDEFKSKMDALFDAMSKDFLMPGLQKFTSFVSDLLHGKLSLDKLTDSITNFGKGIGGVFKGLIFPEKKTGFAALGKELNDVVKDTSRLKKVKEISDKFALKKEKKSGFAILAEDANNLVKQTSRLQKINVFANNLGKNIRSAIDGIDFKGTAQNIGEKLKGALSTVGGVIKSFFQGLMNKDVSEVVSNSTSNVFSKGFGILSGKASDTSKGLFKLGQSLKSAMGAIKAPFEKNTVSSAVGGFVSDLQGLKSSVDDVPLTFGEKIKKAVGDVIDFIANIDYKKLLTAARAFKTVTSVFNGIKLTKSFSGMADNIGGFFESLSKDGLKINAIPEESKFSKLVKVAIAIALVAKAMSMISEIPENRLWSSVGVVAGIAGVMTAIVILLEKMKPAQGADLGGAAKTMFAMSIALYIIAKAMSMLGDQDPGALLAGGAAISAMIFVLTKATKSLKDLKLKTADALAPIGFAIALRLLVGAVAKFGEMNTGQLIKGGVATVLAIEVLKRAVKSLKDVRANAATVLAPLSFVFALGVLLVEVIAFSLIPPGLMAAGLIRVIIMLGLLEGVMKSLKGMNLSAATVAAPLAFAGAILLLMVAVMALGVYPLDKFTRGLACVIALGVVIAGMYALVEFINKKLGANDISGVLYMIPMVIAIGMLGAVAVVLGVMPTGVLIKGGIAVTALAGLLVGVIFLLNLIGDKLDGKIDKSIILALIPIIIGLVVLATTAAVLGLFPAGALAKGVITLIAIGAIIAAMEYVLVKASKEMNISGVNMAAMIVTVIALSMLATTAMMLAFIPGDKLAKAVGVIFVLGVVIGAMEVVLSKSPKINGINIAAMIVTVIAIKMLALTVVLLGLIPLPKLAKGVGVVVVLAAVLGAIEYVISKTSFSAMDLVGLIAIVATIGALIAAVAYLGSMDLGQLGQGVVGLAALVGVLALLCALAGPIQQLAIAFVIFSAGALLIGAAFALVASGVLSLVDAMNILSTINTASLLQNLLVFIPVLGVVVAAFVGLSAAAILLGPAVIPILALAAAFALLGAGLYLIASAIEKFVNSTGQVVTAIANMASFVAKNLGSFLNGIKNAILRGLKYMASNIGAFLKKGGELISGAAKGIAQNAPKVVSKVGEVLRKGLSWISKNLPQWLKAGANLIVKLVSGIAKNAPKIASKVGEALSKGVKKIISSFPQWLKNGKELMGKVASGIGNAAGKLASKAGDAVKKAKNAMAKKKSEFVKVGKDMINGFMSGIASKASALAKKAASVAASAVSAAKAKLKSNSPSKVFIQIGEDVDNGFIIGLSNLAKKVALTSGGVAEGAMEAVKDPLSKVAELINEGMVDDPTITPVMDLSEIQNGANRLYSMMDEASKYSFTGNIELANDTSKSVSRDKKRKEDSDNQMMGALIDAINGLSALIGTTGNVYNVNGVTYDDGSNISSAVRSLIRAAKVEGRA